MGITYRKAKQSDIDTATDLLCLLYDGEGLGLSREGLFAENELLFSDTSQAFFLAIDGDKPVGISHGTLRREYVNGTNDGLKGYLEAIYVLPEYRMNGIAAELVRITERWAGWQGCREFASDSLLGNTESYKFHLKIGFEETERNIFYLKKIAPQSFEILEIDAALRKKIQPILTETWGSSMIVINGKLWDSQKMPGFVAVGATSPAETYEILGYLLYEFHDGLCEIEHEKGLRIPDRFG